MLHKSDYVESGVPLINPADIAGCKVNTKKLKTVSASTADRLAPYRLAVGDVIIGRRGEMGRAAEITSMESQWLCGTGCFFVTPLSVLAPCYLVFLLQSPYLKEALLSGSVGTTMNNLNHQILGNLLIPLPPVYEQEKIIEKYNLICSTIDG